MKWISVNDRLPDSDGDYLVYGNCTNNGDGCDIAHFLSYPLDEFERYIQPTHWMELPDTPKE